MRRAAGLFSNISNTEELKSELLWWDDFYDTTYTDLERKYYMTNPTLMTIVSGDYITCSTNNVSGSITTKTQQNLFEPVLVAAQYYPGNFTGGSDGGLEFIGKDGNSIGWNIGSLPVLNLTGYGNPYNFFGPNYNSPYQYSYSCAGASWNEVYVFCERGYQCTQTNGILKKETYLPYHYPLDRIAQYVRGAQRLKSIRAWRCDSAFRYKRYF